MAKPSAKKPPEISSPDPMPARVDPCLATLVDKPPKGPDWAFEVKWDGYRIAVHIEPGRVRTLTRGGHDWTERFPAIVDDARRLAVKTAILDGEAVVLDDQGRSDFGMLQRALGRLPSAVEAGAIVFFAFDLLYLDGRDLRRLALRERRRLLEPLVAGREGAIRLSEEVQADGDEFFRVACAHGLEGIIAKHVEKPYRSGRGEWWQKITCKRRDSFVIVGFEPSTVPGHLGRLLLAALKGGELVYVGGCGTGWSHDLSRELRKLLEGMATKSPAVALRRKAAVFVEPVLVAEVEYRAWTDDGKLRHASFKGIRDLAANSTIYELQ
ncbi:ATP-dependent DNA ligase [Sinorhizobium medicae]|uniref:non-homologous end-joining DNA ligase n=1 Tax=Sinorhizobium medicae TaxID=110321 RepID=UPI001AACE137|nr:non-homologous end-joining DNA ligase [Sinorhizobium medicae]MBO1943191.1 non-homologous end-joining DNA ligase [Sinorhizobium medicae]MDX0921831.1 ATP-dependent DNA ligase [Sinorhizobium medicae]MDX0926693.1 ATP-dependent DNA ligase [Sinorhizobium medicae]MDX0934134.1 ATP-dependent DNA ligase [Sinorhizobium medicae]MDX0940286.1 ATP-dependent DNA ligase [Sinorhizobium medicae]